LAWYKHHINREQLREVLALLHDAAIPVVLLKGCALTSFLPPEYHVRFQSDSDLLIPTNTIHRTIEVFKKAAWSYTDHTQRTYEKAPVDTLVHRFKEVSFTKETWTNRGGGDIDIHWHCTTPDKHTYTRTALFTEHLWNSARPLAHTLEGGLVPELSDLIIHIIAHGAYRNSIRPIRWVSDIGSLILWGNQPINWSQVAQRAEQYGFTAELYFAVSYLHTHLTELIEQSSPTREYLRILSTPPSRAELREYFSKTETIIVPFLGNFPKLWNVFTDHYVLQHPKQQFPPWIHFTYWKGFIYYIAHEWNLPNPYSLPRFITQKMWGRFTNWAHRNKIFLSLKK
jgi:hypothetical protein